MMYHHTMQNVDLLFQELDTDQIDMDAVKHCINSNKRAPQKIKYSFMITDYDGRSFLHYAAKHGHIGALSILIEVIQDEIKNESSKDVHKQLAAYKKAIDTQDDQGNSPLHLACQYGHTEVVTMLIENGADIFIENQCGEEPLAIAINNHTDEEPDESSDDETLDAKDKSIQRIETIKTLLEFDAGLGVKNLLELYKKVGIAPQFSAFGVVNVIGTGLTKSDPGFELAICTVKDYLEHLRTHPQLNKSMWPIVQFSRDRIKIEKIYKEEKLHIENCRKLFGEHASLALSTTFNSQITSLINWQTLFDKQCELRIKLCNKKLGQFHILNNPQVVELRSFIENLDRLMSGQLQRLCQRVIIANPQNKTLQKSVAAMKQKVSSSHIIHTIPNAHITMNLTKDLNILRQLLKDLQKLNTHLDVIPSFESRPDVRIANSFYRGALGVGVAALIVGLLVYAIWDILDIQANGKMDRRGNTILDDSNRARFTIDIFLIIMEILCGMHFSIYTLGNTLANWPSPFNLRTLFRSNDNSNFALRVDALDGISVQNKLSAIQSQIRALKIKGTLFTNAADAVMNATNVVTLKLAIDDVKNEIEEYIKNNSKDANILLASKTKVGFFQSASSSSESNSDDNNHELITISSSSISDFEEDSDSSYNEPVPLLGVTIR